MMIIDKYPTLVNSNALIINCGGMVASWLVRSSPDRAVRVQALAKDTVLCSWVRDLTLTVPPSTQEYKWVPANCWGKPNKLEGIDPRGSRNTLSHLMLQKPK